ncbi:MAG: PEPxxWA-CTERM sorting domain-containing protein [Caulobacteraceae bacterium]
MTKGSILAGASALAAAVSVVAAPQAASATEFIVNGSFEANNWGPTYVLGLIGNDVTGWYIPNGDGIYPWGINNGSGYGPADTGSQFLVLGRWGTAAQYTIQQTMTGLTPGDTYHLTFAIASEQGCCAVAGVSFLSGSSTAAQDFTAPTSGSFWTAWGHESMDFMATASSVTLQFQDILPTVAGYDLGLDSVSVTGASIPEPASWAMMIIGLGLTGAAMRRRLAKAAVS